MTDCGGCQGLGSHRRNCSYNPTYHPWTRLAEMAEDIGDTIGSNDTGIANKAYSISGEIRQLIKERPFTRSRRFSEPTD